MESEQGEGHGSDVGEQCERHDFLFAQHQEHSNQCDGDAAADQDGEGGVGVWGGDDQPPHGCFKLIVAAAEVDDGLDVVAAHAGVGPLDGFQPAELVEQHLGGDRAC